MNDARHRFDEHDPLLEWRRSVDKRRFMTSRFVRRGASYGAAVLAANKLFPLAPRAVVEADFAMGAGA